MSTEVNEASELIAPLRGDDPAERLKAAQQLAELGEDAQPAAVALVESLQQADVELQEWSVAALEQLGPPQDTDVAALTGLLATQNELVSYWASTLLGRLEGQARQAAGALAHVVESSRYAAAQQRAAWALGRIGSSDPAAIDALKRAASGQDPRLARIAQQALDQTK